MITNADVLTTNKLTELRYRAIQGKFDILAISEVKPKNRKNDINLAQYNIEGYTIESCNICNNIGRGMIIYVNNMLRYNVIDIQQQLLHFNSSSIHENSISVNNSCSILANEALAIDIHINNGKSMMFCLLYRSPTSTLINNGAINNAIRALSQDKYSHILFAGDFNYPHIDWNTYEHRGTENDKEFLFIETLRDCYLTQHIMKPTRGRGDNNPSILDLVLTNNENIINNIDHQAPLGKSDHSVLTVTVKGDINNTINKKRHNYDKGDFKSMKEKLHMGNWKSLFANCLDNVEEQWNIFTKKCFALEKEYIPIKRINNKNNHIIPLSKKDLKILKQKNRSWQSYLQTNRNYIH